MAHRSSGPNENISAGCRLDREDGGIAVVTIDNARRRNCLSAPVERDLVKHLGDLSRDTSCRAIVLTGDGGYFSAGGDVSQMAGADTATALLSLQGLHRIVLLIQEAPMPVVAAVEGGAAGGGLAIAIACDFVVTASDAKLTMAFDRIGLAPDLGAMWNFERRMGLPATRRLSYLGGGVDADQALRLGLVDRVCHPQSVKLEALALANQLAEKSPSANTVIKRSFARPQHTLREALAAEVEAARYLYASDEYQAALRG